MPILYQRQYVSDRILIDARMGVTDRLDDLKRQMLYNLIPDLLKYCDFTIHDEYARGPDVKSIELRINVERIVERKYDARGYKPNDTSDALAYAIHPWRK